MRNITPIEGACKKSSEPEEVLGSHGIRIPLKWKSSTDGSFQAPKNLILFEGDQKSCLRVFGGGYIPSFFQSGNSQPHLDIVLDKRYWKKVPIYPAKYPQTNLRSPLKVYGESCKSPSSLSMRVLGTSLLETNLPQMKNPKRDLAVGFDSGGMYCIRKEG